MHRHCFPWCIAAVLAVACLPMIASISHGEEISATARVDSLFWDCRVEGNRATIKYFEKVTILKPAGAEFGVVTTWSSPLVNLNSFSARLLDAEGKQVYKREKKDMLKICGFGQGFEVYSDECRYSLDIEYPKYPYSVESTKEKELKSLYLLPSVDLDYKIPIRTAVIRLSHPLNQPIRYRLYQVAGDPEVEDKGERRTLTWRFADLAPVKEIFYCPPENRMGRRLALGAEKFTLEQYDFDGLTWKNVGLWKRKLGADPDSIEGQRPASPVTPADARRVADSLYRAVTKNTRYVAAYVGIGGWQPHPLAHIKQRQYGDCKDLTALLVSGLRSNGITAFPCLLYTNDEGSTDTSFVDFRFNHVITMAIIGTDTLWYDPTCSHCPPGEIREDDEGAFTVVATDTGGVLVRTPLSRPQANRIVRVSEVTADSLGRMALKVRAVLSGHIASGLRAGIEHKNRKELDQYIADWLVGSRAQLKVTNYSLADVDDITRPVQIDYTVSCAQPLDWINRTRYFLPFFLTSRNVYKEVETDKRETDVWLGYPWEVYDSVIVSGSLLSASGSVSTPVDTVLSYPWVRVAAHYATGDSVVTASLTQTYTADVVPLSELDDFKSYISRRRWVVDQPIKFVAKTK